MYRKIIAAITTVLITVNCSAQPERSSMRSEITPDAPLKIKLGDKYTDAERTAAIRSALQSNARRVMVFFETANGVRCPQEVRTIDRVCRTDAYDTIDPAVICRVAGDSVLASSQNKLAEIKWRGEEFGDKFKIKFESDTKPCTNDTDATFLREQVCILQDADNLKIETGKPAYFKYKVISKIDGNRCVLDPHFIVRD
ncbi:MAG: hypothetical protein ABJ308_08395 [Halieaceae bacterium]